MSVDLQTVQVSESVAGFHVFFLFSVALGIAMLSAKFGQFGRRRKTPDWHGIFYRVDDVNPDQSVDLFEHFPDPVFHGVV